MKEFQIAVNVCLSQDAKFMNWERLYYETASSLQAAKAICFDYLVRRSDFIKTFDPRKNPVFMSIEKPSGGTCFFQQIN